MKIKKIKAREILDSRGNPTIEVDVFLDQTAMAKQTVAWCAPHIAFKLTTFEKTSPGYRKDLLRFIERTELDAIHWINISRDQLTIETLQ